MNELMTTLSDEMDRMTQEMGQLFSNNLQIKRPHNLITLKDKDGKVTGYSIETVYTPFKKSDIEVTVEKGALTVKCGGKTEESGESKDKTMNHCSISYQAYEFTLPLTEDVDTEKISATAEDGMLRIMLPLKEIVQKEEKSLKIEVK